MTRQILRFVARPYSNDPPYLFHIANHETDVPSALAFLKDLEAEEEAEFKERWNDARAMGRV